MIYDEFGGSQRYDMTLYYVDGNHVGTWMEGEGWIFESAYQ